MCRPFRNSNGGSNEGGKDVPKWSLTYQDDLHVSRGTVMEDKKRVFEEMGVLNREHSQLISARYCLFVSNYYNKLAVVVF
jgi:hypothetical protein